MSNLTATKSEHHHTDDDNFNVASKDQKYSNGVAEVTYHDVVTDPSNLVLASDGTFPQTAHDKAKIKNAPDSVTFVIDNGTTIISYERLAGIFIVDRLRFDLRIKHPQH